MWDPSCAPHATLDINSLVNSAWTSTNARLPTVDVMVCKIAQTLWAASSALVVPLALLFRELLALMSMNATSHSMEVATLLLLASTSLGPISALHVHSAIMAQDKPPALTLTNATAQLLSMEDVILAPRASTRREVTLAALVLQDLPEMDQLVVLT